MPTGEKLDDTRRRIRTLKVFVWISLVAVIVTGVADLIQAIPSNIYVTGAAMVGLLLMAWQLKRGAYQFASYGVMFVLSGLIFYHTVDLGVQLGSYLYFICLLVAVPFMVDADKRYQIEFLSAIPLFFLLLSFVLTSTPSEHLSPDMYWSGMKTNVLLFAFIMFLFVYSTAYVSRKLTRKLARIARNLQSLLEETSFIIWSLDAQFKLIQANQNFTEQFSLYVNKPLVKGVDVVAMLPEKDRRFWIEKYNRVLMGEVLDFTISYFNGKEKFYLEVHLSPVMGDDDEVIAASCYANNITNRVRVTAELEQSRSLLSDTLDLAKVGIWFSYPMTDEIEWDARTAQIMGLEPASVKLPVDAYYARIHPDDLAEVKRAIAAFEAQESELMLEHRILTPDGELRYILEKAKAQRDDFGKLLKVTGYTQDITDLRLGEHLNLQTATLIAEVKMATEQLLSIQELTQSVPLAIQRVADAIQARYAWVFEHRSFENGAGARLVSPTQIGGDLPPEVFEVLQTGNSYGEMGVEDWYEVLRQGGVKKGNADIEDVSTFLKACNLGRYVVLPIFLEGEYWGFIGFDNMEHGRIWTKNDEGILQGFCNSLGVILSLSAYQANLKAAKELAEHATQTKTNFLSNISHEIRTPMNAIMGLTDLLLPGEKDDERLEYLNAIKFSADNLLRLINDLLDLSKIEANKMTFDRQPFALKELLRQFKKVMGYLTKEKGLQFDFDVAPEVPNMLSGDAVRLNQILLNLGSNAVKFTEQGSVGFILTVEKETPDLFWLKFTFKDTGIGIAPEKISLIFDSFEQAEKYISRKFGGTGLGLTITHKLVEMMEGQIEVESEMNKGSLFEVLLPFGKVAHDVHNEMRYNVMAEKNLRQKRILIVEDNKINIMLVSRLLKSWQADFEVAENGLEAQERLVAERFDLVLLDLQMPVMNGFELMEKLRKGEAGPQTDIPVMALTADAYEQTRGKALSLGFNDFITKPIHADDLYQKIYALTLGQAQF